MQENQQKRQDFITANSLLRHLDSGINGAPTYLVHLKNLATIKKVGKLLDGIDDEDGYPGSIPTSQLRARLARIEAAIRSAPPPERPEPPPPSLDLDFLRPSFPPPPTLGVLLPPPAPNPAISSPILPSSPTETKADLIPAVATSKLPPPPPTQSKLHKPTSPPTASSSSSPPIETASDSLLAPPKTGPLPAPAPSTLRSRPRPSRRITTPPPSTPSSTPGLLLEHHATLQQSLLSSLTSMSSQLKGNALTFSVALEKDKNVMENAKEKLEGNLGRMQKEGGRLGGYEKKSRGTTWIVMGMVAVVAVGWTLTFLLIKVS